MPPNCTKECTSNTLPPVGKGLTKLCPLSQGKLTLGFTLQFCPPGNRAACALPHESLFCCLGPRRCLPRQVLQGLGVGARFFWVCSPLGWTSLGALRCSGLSHSPPPTHKIVQHPVCTWAPASIKNYKVVCSKLKGLAYLPRRTN